MCCKIFVILREERSYLHIGMEGAVEGQYSGLLAGDKLLQVGLCYTGISQAEAAPGLSDEHSGDCTAVH